MSKETRISIVVLGNEDYLKKSLIALLLKKDVFAKGSSDAKNEKYENETYVVTTQNLHEAKGKMKFSSEQHLDMCLVLVEDGVSPENMKQYIEELQNKNEPLKDKFRVVLPLGCKHDSSQFPSYTMDNLFKTLKEMAEKRSGEQATPQTSKPSWLTLNPSSWFSADNKKSSKETHSDIKVNLVLLGMSGTGKSASGNTILGKRKFESKSSSMPITRECQAAETEINGTRVRVIDTPDIFNDEIKSSVKRQHVTQCNELICQSDPCVYLLVLHVSRFTDGERDILRKFEEAFGRKAREQTILLFTRGEDLQRDKMSLKDYIQDCQPKLRNIIEQCGGRCVVFENKTSRQYQVTELMQTVNMMLNK